MKVENFWSFMRQGNTLGKSAMTEVLSNISKRSQSLNNNSSSFAHSIPISFSKRQSRNPRSPVILCTVTFTVSGMLKFLSKCLQMPSIILTQHLMRPVLQNVLTSFSSIKGQKQSFFKTRNIGQRGGEGVQGIAEKLSNKLKSFLK